MILYSAVTFFVIPLGIPTFYFVLLHRNRQGIYPGNAGTVIDCRHVVSEQLSMLYVNSEHMTLLGHLVLKRRVLLAALRLRALAQAARRTRVRHVAVVRSCVLPCTLLCCF